jgi:TetR/AcrR family transcriptional regulator, mexCD-oprJ operon repressor
MRQSRLANEAEYNPKQTDVPEPQRTSSQPLLREAQAAPRQTLRERVATAILEAAARALVDQGAHASMNDVAAEAGIARATVYRYFPSRQALLDALAELAVNDAGARLSSARIDQVPVEEGITRAVRALVDVGDYFVALASERVQADTEQFDSRVTAPLNRLMEQGQRSGAVRGDVPASWLTESLVGLVVTVLLARPTMGQEDTIVAIASLFVDGARAREEQQQ